MLSRLAGHRVLLVAAVLALALAASLAVRIALSGPAPYKGPPATAVGGTAVTYTAAPHQANHVTVTQTWDSGGRIITYLIDDVVPIDASEHSCTYPDAKDRTKVACTATIEEMATSPYPTLLMNLGDANDTATVHNNTPLDIFLMGYNVIRLGAGNDNWTGTGLEAQAVYGDNGDDILTVHTGAYADGGKGNDTIYADGEINGARGGPGNDVLRGGAGSQGLYGGQGNDSIYGGPGDDGLYGDQGDDGLYGGSGDDKLYGGVHSDVIHGNSGDDLLEGDNANDNENDKGDDKLYGGPGTDKLNGGFGKDTAQQD
ncbi:calcium-binding protein [Streptomyces sp. NPDC059396]|uniref:calcium-binding protein n=1 Tax=Streptomyces sp. NPDC059396 TaxID=3346819 RepID=UPI0036B8E429